MRRRASASSMSLSQPGFAALAGVGEPKVPSPRGCPPRPNGRADTAERIARRPVVVTLVRVGVWGSDRHVSCIPRRPRSGDTTPAPLRRGVEPVAPAPRLHPVKAGRCGAASSAGVTSSRSPTHRPRRALRRGSGSQGSEDSSCTVSPAPSIATAAISLLALGGATAADAAPAIPLTNGQEIHGHRQRSPRLLHLHASPAPSSATRSSVDGPDDRRPSRRTST